MLPASARVGDGYNWASHQDFSIWDNSEATDRPNSIAANSTAGVIGWATKGDAAPGDTAGPSTAGQTSPQTIVLRSGGVQRSLSGLRANDG